MSATNAGGYCNAKDDMREDYSQTKCCITLCSFMKCQDVFSHEILSLHANYSRAYNEQSDICIYEYISNEWHSRKIHMYPLYNYH